MDYHRVAAPVLERIFGGGTISGLSEWELLERYLERRDEVAFEALVARHGPMVMGVCRRVLDDQTDVEDAFQATFLVLVRKARQLGPRDAIGPWLYGVAIRVAMRARSEAVRRRRFEPIAGEGPTAHDTDPAGERELAVVIDEELGRLPSKYRSPIVLCYLEGHTHEEAARLLRWPVGTVKGRLARARDQLRSRLARRGLAPGAATLTLVLSRDSSAAVNRELIDRTVRASLKLALGHVTAQVVSTSITNLVEGVLTSMFVNTIKCTLVAAVVAGAVLSGAGLMARQVGVPAPKKPQRTAARILGSAGAVRAFLASDAGDAPQAAEFTATKNESDTMRDLQQQLARAARLEWDNAVKDLSADGAGIERAYQASKRLLDVQKESATAPADVVTAHEGHFGRIRELARLENDDPASDDSQQARVKVYAAEAALWLAQAKAGDHPETKSGSGDASGKGQGEAAGDAGLANDPKSRAILAKLEEPISIPFGDETPLEDVLKYLKQATTTEKFAGIPIYVDPVGLQEADKSMTSTVRIELDGVPLRRTLQLLLKQLGLAYSVEDGLLFITSEQSEHVSLGPSMRTAPPMMLKVLKAQRGELPVDEMKEAIEFLRTRRQLLAIEDDQNDAPAQPAKAPAPDDVKRLQDQINELIKEMRELKETLKAEKPSTKGPETKSRAGGLQ
jgi:RNA polymerase sigma factor (sigma-70 family)